MSVSLQDQLKKSGLIDEKKAKQLKRAKNKQEKLARKTKGIVITREWQDALMTFFNEKYASPDKFHKSCKTRLTDFNRVNDLPGGWSDNCLLSILILDFYNWCDENNENYPPLQDKHINKYNGI